MDKITLKSIEYFASHGYYDSEREKGNRFEVDIVAEGDFRKAANEEDLNDTFDYETAEKTASEIMNGTSEKLIETLCSNIGEKLFSMNSSIRSLKVAVRKLNPPLKNPAAYSEIEMQWKR